MNNVLARVYSAKQKLDAGFPVSAIGTVLFDGPAQLSMPTRPWERAASLDGVFSATLYAQSANDLTQSDAVVTEDPRTHKVREWRVISHANAGLEWRLELSHREVRRAT